MLIILDGRIINYHLIQFIDTSAPNADGTIDVVNKDATGGVLQILDTKPNLEDAIEYVNKLSDKLVEANFEVVDAR